MIEINVIHVENRFKIGDFMDYRSYPIAKGKSVRDGTIDRQIKAKKYIKRKTKNQISKQTIGRRVKILKNKSRKEYMDIVFSFNFTLVPILPNSF